MRESAALRAAAEAREAELARYKKLLSGGSAKTPSRPESANKFYAALLAAVAESGMEGARVSGVSERGAEALFTISGHKDYDKLRRFLASLRGLQYPSRVSQLLLEGSAGGEVVYSVEISTRTAEGGGAER